MFLSSSLSINLTLATSATRFVLVNNRVPRMGGNCALCGGIVEQGYVRDSQTRLIYCDTQCFAGGRYTAMPTRNGVCATNPGAARPPRHPGKS
jgi:hypothetical protein